MKKHPPTADDPGKAVRLITCTDTTEAYLIKGRLNNAGIECFLTNENITQILPHYNNMLGSGIQIFVNEHNLAKAREITGIKPEPQTQDIHCPYCGSEHISSGTGMHKAFKAINILFRMLFFLPTSHLKSDYHCKNCGKDF